MYLYIYIYIYNLLCDMFIYMCTSIAHKCACVQMNRSVSHISRGVVPRGNALELEVSPPDSELRLIFGWFSLVFGGEADRNPGKSLENPWKNAEGSWMFMEFFLQHFGNSWGIIGQPFGLWLSIAIHCNVQRSKGSLSNSTSIWGAQRLEGCWWFDVGGTWLNHHWCPPVDNVMWIHRP